MNEALPRALVSRYEKHIPLVNLPDSDDRHVVAAGTPDKPLLKLEIKTEDPLKLEGAIHAVLDYRGRRVMGGGEGWVLISRNEPIAAYEFIAGTVATKAQTSRQHFASSNSKTPEN